MFILSTKMGENKNMHMCICASTNALSHRIHMYKKCLKYNYKLYNMVNNYYNIQNKIKSYIK